MGSTWVLSVTVKSYVQSKFSSACDQHGSISIWLFLEIEGPVLRCPYKGPTIWGSVLGPLILGVCIRAPDFWKLPCQHADLYSN